MARRPIRGSRPPSTPSPRRSEIVFLPGVRLFWVLGATAATAAVAPAAGLAGSVFTILLGLVDAVRCRGLGAPEIDVELAPRMGLGQPGEIVLRVTNRRGRAVHLRVTVDVPAALAAPGAYRVHAVDVPDRGRVRVTIPICATRRGRHPSGDVHARIRGPLGLTWWQVRFRSKRAVAVVPGLREARSHRLHAWHHSLRHMGFRSTRQRFDTGAFESMRDYVRGDDPRRIDWKTSARQGRMIVRRYQAERNQDIVLCIDTGRLMAELVGGQERLDYALSAAVVLTDVARVWNDNVGVFVFSDRIQAVLPPSRHPPERIPLLLAEVETRAVEPNYPRAFVTLSRMVSRRSLLVVFSDVIDEEVSAPLATYMAQLAHRHMPLFVALRNPDLHQSALATVTTAAEAYQRAAATEMVLARAKTLRAMRRAGIQVVDARPDGVIEAAVNRYVEIKTRGAL